MVVKKKPSKNVVDTFVKGFSQPYRDDIYYIREDGLLQSPDKLNRMSLQGLPESVVRLYFHCRNFLSLSYISCKLHFISYYNSQFFKVLFYEMKCNLFRVLLFCLFFSCPCILADQAHIFVQVSVMKRNKRVK